MQVDKDISHDIHHKAKIYGHGRSAQEQTIVLCPQSWLEPQEGERSNPETDERRFPSTVKLHGC